MVISVPYIVGGTTSGAFNIALQTEHCEVSHGPLASRAWAFQEEYLANRIICFTRPGVWWKCKTVDMWEGAVDTMRYQEYGSWLWLLDTYSRKELTIAGDRLYALRGIAEAMKQTRSDRYYPEYGVWEEDLRSQLLWVEHGTFYSPLNRRDRLPNMPTWSWAATAGHKRWFKCRFDDEPYQSLNEASALLSIDTVSGSLVSSGQLTRLPLTPIPISMSVLEASVTELNSCSPERVITWDHHNRYACIAGRDESSVLGLASYDAEPSSLARCFVLYAQDRIISSLDDHVDLEQMHSSIVEQIGLMLTRDSEREISLIIKVEEMIRNSEKIYWCLLLEPVDESRYKRVGVAMLYPQAPDVLGAEYTDFTLI